MAINQLNKYVWLVETIHRARKRGGITLREIQSRWKDSDLSEGTELSRRTFINNLHSIEELFEISICCGKATSESWKSCNEAKCDGVIFK